VGRSQEQRASFIYATVTAARSRAPCPDETNPRRSQLFSALDPPPTCKNDVEQARDGAQDARRHRRQRAGCPARDTHSGRDGQRT
jgi:hypothetical protein